LIWHPEIGDEISNRVNPTQVSVLVDTGGLTPPALRDTYIWLPTVEQMLLQIEVRQAILFHAGLEMSEHSYCYKTVIQSKVGSVEAAAYSFRESVGKALHDLLLVEQGTNVH
ncbi:MAG: hypothetical protein KDD70_12775, partial [Bdellovibrionales bacterium]|nr:hypothetical protein [Bdellovibrionales bacterium]